MKLHLPVFSMSPGILRLDRTVLSRCRKSSARSSTRNARGSIWDYIFTEWINHTDMDTFLRTYYYCNMCLTCVMILHAQRCPTMRHCNIKKRSRLAVLCEGERFEGDTYCAKHKSPVDPFSLCSLMESCRRVRHDSWQLRLEASWQWFKTRFGIRHVWQQRQQSFSGCILKSPFCSSMTSCTITRQCILDSSDFLACYELLLKEVICPHLKSNLIEELSQISQPHSCTTSDSISWL